VRLEVYM
jgi:hypothetical protein